MDGHYVLELTFHWHRTQGVYPSSAELVLAVLHACRAEPHDQRTKVEILSTAMCQHGLRWWMGWWIGWWMGC